ncbi:MAG: DNA mismatch repair protein MutS [Rhodobacterales bacterium]|nr:DNA mismatch repair protein MutS [Rhodobacterales bacterium]NCT13290.1 DNA mismatch repair protein MutS [Rhodobacterales bacterium]
MRRPRHLSAEERALWDMVARRTKPLDPPKAADHHPEPAPPPQIKQPPRALPLRPFHVGQAVDHRRDHDLLPALPERLHQAPLQMDHKAYGKLKRGKLDPEGRIDLHGMTLAEAHPALVTFILSSHAAQRRLVLVITGKGKVRDDLAPMPVRQGALRHQVPQWLALPPIGHMVMQVAPAHLKHGGAGAYYVYLRRHR